MSAHTTLVRLAVCVRECAAAGRALSVLVKGVGSRVK